MVKVIQKGDEHRKRVNCLRCGAILEYGLDDRRTSSYHDAVMKLDIYESYIVCPECFQSVMVDRWAKECL